MIKQFSGSVAAIVVGFLPVFDVLDRLLLTLLDEADLVIFVDNGGGQEFLVSFPELKNQVEYLPLASNRGLGYALNEGFKLAVSRRFQFVATFDQDSSPSPLMIAGLLDAHRRLIDSGVVCAAVGPHFYDSREGQKRRFPLYKQVGRSISAKPLEDAASGLIEVDVLITSGMLVNAKVWANGIVYNPGLFVDYTDTDWCFRARAAGFKLFVCPDQEMNHALSDAAPIRLFGLTFLRYSPLRRYYYFRNTLTFITQPYVSWAWRSRLFFGLIVRFISNVFIDTQKVEGLKMTLRGLRHGLKEKMGPYH